MQGLGVKRGERKAGGTRRVARAPRRGTLVYHAFDLLHLDGWDLLPTYRSRSASACCGWCCASIPGALRQPRARARRGLPGGRRRRRASRAASPSCGAAATSRARARARGSRSRRAASRSWSWSATSPARAATPTWDRCWWPPAKRTAGASPGTSAAASTGARASCCAELVDAHALRGPAAARCTRPRRAPVTASRATSSAPSSPSGPPTDCFGRRSTRAWRSVATRRPCRVRSSSRAGHDRGGPGRRGRAAPHSAESRPAGAASSSPVEPVRRRGRSRDPAELEALDAMGERRTLGGRWSRGRAHQPRQGALPRAGLHQARPGALLHDHRAGHPARTCASGRSTCIAGPTGSAARRSSGRSRSPRTRPSGWRAGTTPMPAARSRTPTS